MVDDVHHAVLPTSIRSTARCASEFRRYTPGFALLSNAATTAGGLDTMTKELIALAIGIVRGCHVSYATRSFIPYRARYPFCLAKT